MKCFAAENQQGHFTQKKKKSSFGLQILDVTIFSPYFYAIHIYFSHFCIYVHNIIRIFPTKINFFLMKDELNMNF
jgi:hypothetical protein